MSLPCSILLQYDDYYYGGAHSRRYWYPGINNSSWIIIDFKQPRIINKIVALSWAAEGPYGVHEYSVEAWDIYLKKWNSKAIITPKKVKGNGIIIEKIDPIKTSRIRFNVHNAGSLGPVIVEIAAFEPNNHWVVESQPSTIKIKKNTVSHVSSSPSGHNWAVIIG